jgi:hypothetical protein
VQVLLDGRPAGSFRAGGEIGEHRVHLPAGEANGAARGYLELTLKTETFVLASVSASRDRRALGVMWESAAVVQ